MRFLAKGLHLLAVIAVIQLVPLNAPAQKVEKSITDVLANAEIVAGNITTAITAHIADDPEFQIAKQLPEDKYAPPKILVRKDGTIIFDWTPGQQARSLMEDIRQGLHALQSSKKALGIDSIALAGGVLAKTAGHLLPRFARYSVLRPRRLSAVLPLTRQLED